MNDGTQYDVAIAGGGMAGLSAAIMLGRKGHRVVLFEKESYPFHKVCGEYISLESWDFLLSLQLKLEEWKLPVIKNLSLTSPDGTELHQHLPLGGFGISRYRIDQELRNIALRNNVQIHEGTRVQGISFANEIFHVQTDKGTWASSVCCSATGKRSNLDVKWRRPFVLEKPNALNNFIAVKYHALLEHPRSLIALHNFQDGYCGISPIEDNKTCICYLTNASSLRKNNNDIRLMEEKILFRNVFIKEAFENASMQFDKPLTISQISFDRKEQVTDHVLMLGDAAGMITPLCGNGMSMALSGSKIAVGYIEQFLAHKINRQQLENNYALEWKKTFGRRLWAGRVIQSLFGKEWITNKTVRILKYFPGIVQNIITQTHG
ncbi:MAG TPA: NAD(P)/FAD-dependent oxidoreductase [Flavitalea sp.]|nr:NAD(P)/FAD-dependent oxidoreductase [Flavitalea sp.]